MKYLHLYEAFDSDAISKITKYVKNKVGKKDANKFLEGLKTLLKNHDFPIHKISDEDVEYTSARKALFVGKEDVDITNDKGIYCIKFWFSLEKGFIGYTGVGDKKMENFISFVENSQDKMTESISNYIKRNLLHDGKTGLKTGILTRITKSVESYRNLRDGDEVIACLGDDVKTDNIVFGSIFKEDDRSVYILQNNEMGSIPYSNWENNRFRYSWSILKNNSIGNDHCLLYKYTRNDEPLTIGDFDNVDKPKTTPFEFNLPMSSSGKLKYWSKYNDDHTSLYNKNWEDIENADFAVILYVDDMLSKGFVKRSETRDNREESRKGAIKFMNDDEIKDANIKRYMGIMISKMGIASDKLDLKNLQKYISIAILGDFSFFSLKMDVPEFRQYTIAFNNYLIGIMKSIKHGDEDRTHEIYEKLVNRFERTTKKSNEYKKRIDKNLRLFTSIEERGEIFDLYKKYFLMCGEIGTGIKTYVLRQEINSVEDYVFLCNKIISITSTIQDDLFSTKSIALKYTMSELFSNGNTEAITRYLKDNSSIDEEIKKMKRDIEGLKNIQKYIKSILV